jgi:hypothetical protein
VDNAAYEEWESSIVNGGKELDVGWQNISYDGFDSVLGY